MKINVYYGGRGLLDDPTPVSYTHLGRHNRVVNLSNPIVDTRLADGSRVNIVLAPVSLDGSTITIRKFPEKALDMPVSYTHLDVYKRQP